MRPRGNPPTPSAMSRPSDPVGMTLISGAACSVPRRMMEPLPYCFSIVPIASSMALSRLGSRCISFAILRLLEGNSGAREVLRPLRAHLALVHDHLADARRPAVLVTHLCEHVVQMRLAFFHPSDGHVRAKRTLLLFKPQV